MSWKPAVPAAVLCNQLLLIKLLRPTLSNVASYTFEEAVAN